MIDLSLVLALALVLGWPLGHYLSAVMKGSPMRADRLFNKIESPLYRLLGVDPARGMRWQVYAKAFLFSNLILALLVWVLLMCQAWLPLNPDGVPNMRWDLALHTMVSFLTNTNQQHYSGQAQLSYLSQMTCVVGLQIMTPMMGLALVVATLRGLFGGRMVGQAGQPIDVGNYWADVIRPAVRVFIPLAVVFALLLTAQGVPATLSAGPLAHPVDASAGMPTQKIPLGPVAAMVSVKQLGTNGGGWYGPNSSVALENPSPLTNLLQCLALILLPVAIVFMISPFTGRKKFTALVLGTMLLMSFFSAAAGWWLENHGPVMSGHAMMEGKEVRVGVDASAVWSAFTTQSSNGSVNAMHDSLNPLTGLVAMSNMLINAIWGGVGCGLQQFLVYLLLSVFLAGLMTGRTPELFGRKVEAGEVKLLAVLILLQPLVLLGMTALTLSLPSFTGNSNPGFHGISQVFYEFTSAFANNGSGFEGLADASYWWNLSCSLVLLLGRYPALILPLIIASRLGSKRVAPEGGGSLQIETPTFALTLIAVVIILTLLQFMPVLVLGPIAEHLSLMTH